MKKSSLSPFLHEVLTTSNGTLLINGVSFASLENIATEGDDTLTGTAQNDKIIALGGNDTLDAGEGSDIIEAGAGGDTITETKMINDVWFREDTTKIERKAA